jgi:hypothetical protein
LAPFQVDPQTAAICNARTKWRKEDEEVYLETTFRQLYWKMGIMTLFLHIWLFHLQRTL